ncbi:hypothetical protein EDF62_1604 [Leucobacter luti]|uniref:Uncharacterized protein n=1 Tax=Leucobacter luti TaxID=340320 RepID=A0A4R6S0C4_9MICO|nr:hypothetical protein EDF62_1604 [Leucobacter luti]
MYDRKGYTTYDPLGGKRNTAYGSDADDVVIQVSVRVPNCGAASQLTGLVDQIARAAQERTAAEELAQLDREQAELDQRRAQLAGRGN